MPWVCLVPIARDYPGGGGGGGTSLLLRGDGGQNEYARIVMRFEQKQLTKKQKHDLKLDTTGQ